MTDKKLHLALLFGGDSSEHDVSKRSAHNIYEAVDKNKYDVSLFLITRDGIILSNEDSLRVFDGEEENEGVAALTFATLIIQGVATSIDALSVGFAIADYSSLEALVSTLIIGITTFIICIFGLELGKKVGKAFSDKATLFGGCILIIIGLEIFIKGVFF